MVQPLEPLGIVIQNGSPAKQPALIWAYVWADDDENDSDHWHRHAPKWKVA